jgi:hypothetical protein
VVARSRETDPDSTARAAIFVNGKASGDSTPYTFRYRPATELEIVVEGALAGYCTNAADTLVAAPDEVNTVLLDFEYTHGTVGFTSDPGVKNIYYDGRRLGTLRTPAFPDQYLYVPCMATGVHTAYAANTLDEQQCSPTMEFAVTAGETTLVFFECPSGAFVAEARRPAPAAVALRESPAPGASSGATLTDGVWLIDLADEASSDDDRTLQVAATASVVCQPSLSSDGKYVAYITGAGRERRIMVCDVSGLVAGGPASDPIVIGMPGSFDQTECWRLPERVEWFPGTTQRKLMVSLSKCRGGSVEDDFEAWVADLSRFLD